MAYNDSYTMTQKNQEIIQWLIMTATCWVKETKTAFSGRQWHLHGVSKKPRDHPV